MAGMFAVYHGPQGLKTIASRIHRLTAILAEGLRRAGVNLFTQQFFDTLQIDLGSRAETVYRAALTAGYNLRRVSANVLAISLDETTSRNDVAALFKLIAQTTLDIEAIDAQLSAASPNLPAELLRTDAILQHPVFNTHHTEHEMLRYLKSLAKQGSGARSLDDFTRLLHHEAECDQRDDSGYLAGIRGHSPVCAA
jgi:glycine dehydrogenase